MKLDRILVVALLAGILVLSPSAYGITISVGSNAGGFTENINAGDKDAVFSSTMIAANSLSHSIEGRGSLRESHSVSNTAGANAEVGVDIRQAVWYSYSYDLSPGQGSSWPASRFAQVAASEQLDVFNAKYIQAYANALNSKGYSAGVSTVVSDPGKEASLTGYRNLAMASKNEAFASQTAESAFSPDGFILADSGADFTQLKLRPLQFREDTTDASIRVDSGIMGGYSDLASASANGVTASQQMDSATGDQIRTRSESASWTASLFQGLKKTAGAKVSTRAEGTLTRYKASAESSKDYAQADQVGHIAGTFTSTAVSGKASKTRTSNYGTMYDFDMQAKKDASGSYATGNLGYYVDNVSPIANRIQGAVDASESGDVINVAPGTYFENVQIDKSLNVLGAGASDTIVNGQQNGSVFTIGSQDNTGLDVALSGMTVQNGSGTTVENGIHGDVYSHGGGIINHANLTIEDSSISGNNANWQGVGLGSALGGGIYNFGTLYMNNSSVSGNMAKASGYDGAAWGGGIFNIGRASLDNSYISGNTAIGEGSGVDYGSGSANGGGIYSEGDLNINGSYIYGNTATGYGSGVIQGSGQGAGGGILISGNLNISDSYICDNTATGYGFGTSAFSSGDGGGIFGFGTLNIAGSCISGNIAKGYGSGISGFDDGSGGGIFSFGTLNIVKSSISGNIAEAYGTGDGFEGLGGGIFNLDTLNLESVSISDNRAFRGGGIINYGMVNLESGSIDHNKATLNGGGIFNDGFIIGNRSIVHDNSPDDILP